MSFVVVILLSAVAAHLVAVALGLPAISLPIQSGECYYVDTSNLPAVRSSPGSAARSLKAILEGEEDAPRAQVTKNKDGSVDFVVNCEATMYESTTGALWTIIPEYGITCRDTPAYRVVDFNVDRQTKCTLGSWAPSNVHQGTKPGFDNHITYEPVTIGKRCGFLGIGRVSWKAWASWKIDSSERWQFCNKARQPTSLVRKDPNGNIAESIAFEQSLTVDPAAIGRPYGWYTSGDKEVIAHASYDEGRGGHLLFFTPDDWQRYMEQYHFHPGLEKVNILPPEGVAVQPNALQCKSRVRIPNGNTFSEFQEPCAGVWASQADDPTAGIKIMTLSDLWCTVDVGFGDDNMTTVIAINTRSPVTLKGADRWRCTTEDQYGTNCGANHSYELFTAVIVNASLRTQITTLSAEVEGNYHDISLENPFDFFDFSSMKETLSTIALVLVILLVVGVVVFIIIKVVMAKYQQHKSEIAIGMQAAPEKVAPML